MNGYEFDLGFLGGGQLARMSIQAAQRMGLNCISLDPDENSPAAQIASSVTGALNDAESVAEIIRRSAKITLENEFIPARVIRQAFAMTGRNLDALLPGINSLELIQDKYHQRKAFKEAALKGPKFALVEDDGALAVASIGFPMILKARFGGYDGKGTQLAESPLEFEELSMIWRDGGWYAEEFVHFKREIAVMVYRTPAFEYAFPTMETRQTHHVCDLVYPAANIDARDIALAAVRAVEGFGLYGVEMFETEQGILINEIAPRPHNSGHFSLDWGGISQFETHVRLCMDLPIPRHKGKTPVWPTFSDKKVLAISGGALRQLWRQNPQPTCIGTAKPKANLDAKWDISTSWAIRASPGPNEPGPHSIADGLRPTSLRLGRG